MSCLRSCKALRSARKVVACPFPQAEVIDKPKTTIFIGVTLLRFAGCSPAPAVRIPVLHADCKYGRAGLFDAWPFRSAQRAQGRCFAGCLQSPPQKTPTGFPLPARRKFRFLPTHR